MRKNFGEVQKQLEVANQKRRNLKKQLLKEQRKTLVLSILCFVFAAIALYKSVDSHFQEQQISSLEETKIEMNQVIDDYRSQMSQFGLLRSELGKTILNLDEANQVLEQKYNANADLLNYYRGRQDLYNKYEYALFYEGERTDINYEHILTLERMAADNCYGTDAVALTLALVMTESHGIASAKNDKATGLGQLIDDTAKYSYEVLLGNGEGSYKKEYAEDPELNLKMSLAYVNDLCQKHLGDPYKVIEDYRGLYSTKYIKAVEKKLDEAGLELKALQLY